MAEAKMSEAPAGSKKLESTVFAYDTSGNTLSETRTTYNPDTPAVIGTQSKQYEWTKGNQLKKSIVDSQETRYRYNAAGQRIEKINHDNAPTRYLYEGNHIMLELDINGNQIAKNIRGLSLAKRTVTGKQLYYFNNAHGDVTTLLAANGAISGKYYYDAFGNLEEEVDGQGNPYKYAGYEHDNETGLYYLRARYYSPKSARFMSEDSYRGDRRDPLSLNLYTYCHNEPIRYIDPTGHVYLHDGMDEGSYYNYTGYQYLKDLEKQVKKQGDESEIEAVAKKLEYYDKAISAGEQVITNQAVRKEVERLEEQAYGPSKSSAASTAKSTNVVEPPKGTIGLANTPKIAPTQGTGQNSQPIIINTNYLYLDGDVLLNAIRGKDPNTLVSICGHTMTAEEWYLLKFDGAIQIGASDGAAGAPFRPQDYDFPFAKNYEQYETAYRYGAFAKAVVVTAAGVAEFDRVTKSASTTTNPIKPQADYSGLQQQAFNNAGSGTPINPNPFKGKSPAEIDSMFRNKGYETRGNDPVNGYGGYVNPKTSRSYHIDYNNRFNEAPHVDVNRLRTYNGILEKKKLYLY